MNCYVVVTITGKEYFIMADDFSADSKTVDFVEGDRRVARFYVNGISGFFKNRDFDPDKD